MTDTGLYYALSTIAQCAAALAALIGLLGLWRLDRLPAERHTMLEGLVKGLITANIEASMLSAEAAVRTARRIVEQPSSPQEWQAKAQIETPLARWEAIPGEQRRLMQVLSIFLGVTLVLILAPAVIGIVYVDQLKPWAWTPKLIVLASAWQAGAPAWVVWQATRSIP